jgi:hypothetical protein
MFPKVRDALGRKALRELGDTMEQAKKSAPRRPHPKAPDTPPANLLLNSGAAVLDSARAAAGRVLSRD